MWLNNTAQSKVFKRTLSKLYGAMELAPLMDLADMIVDIVDTGNTLKANGMEPWDLIADISSRPGSESCCHEAQASAYCANY